MELASRIILPDHARAILWDMDGVLLDTLGLDVTLCNELLREAFGDRVEVSREYIRSLFAYHPPDFWRMILRDVGEKFGISEALDQHGRMLARYNQVRNNTVFQVNPGIEEILAAARKAGIKSVVVSNNPTEDVQKIIDGAGLTHHFDRITGNDIRKIEKKPAPDPYLLGAELAGFKPENCVAVEDSLIGAQAGFSAGCFTIGVATGGADFSALEQSSHTHRVYKAFTINRLSLSYGKVTKKSISTPNDFVSHMIEHIAWRLGCQIDLDWNNNDWTRLGETMGKKISGLRANRNVGVGLGMIDDGSAEVMVESDQDAGLKFDTTSRIDKDWFLSLRCEQMPSGKPAIQLLEGLCQGLDAFMDVRLCSLEDPHHAWEGIFRSVGIALERLFRPETDDRHITNTSDMELEENVSSGDISVLARSLDYGKVLRSTAESHVMIGVDFSKSLPNGCEIRVSDTIDVGNLRELLFSLAEEAGFTIQVEFTATALGSSHVVVEDIALVLGRALKEIMIKRMTAYGINGAGSSLRSLEDFQTQPIRVGISAEGRKFWKIVSFHEPFREVRKNVIIGHGVCETLFSEDLDDFLDGLAGGLGCSIMVHIRQRIDPDAAWRMIFKHLGKAVAMAFAPNPHRVGVPPGVKATLS